MDNRIFTAEEYAELFEQNKDSILLDGEEAHQMTDINPRYYITNKARVLSVFKKGINVKKQSYRNKKEAMKSSSGCSGAKACVALSTGVQGGSKPITLNVHTLVAKYFDVEEYTSESVGNDRIEVHHQKKYDMNNAMELNEAENLIKLPQEIHNMVHHIPELDASKEEIIKFMQRINKLCKNDEATVIIGGDDTAEIHAIPVQEAANLLQQDNVKVEMVMLTPIWSKE